MLSRLLAVGTLGLALGGLAQLSHPGPGASFSLTGDTLGLDQRDVRVFNNFVEPTANDNQTPDPDLPGALGATQAIWKAHLEWGSVPFAGTGDQDPTQAVLGDGGANFDNTWQGETDGPGSANGNVHSELFDPNPGSLLAFSQVPSSDGWKIQYLAGWPWQDGPGDDGTLDLQGVATHEIGHVLGLAHTAAPGATMSASLSGSGVAARSLSADDVAGLQAVYGVAAVDKPVITGTSGSTNTGGLLVVHGSGFSATGNAVWFTKRDSDGDPVIVTGLASSQGGSRLELTVPADVADGSLLVRRAGAGGASLSNEWPFDHDPGLFEDLGPSGLTGTSGEPRLTGAGDLTPGTGLFDIVCTGAQPGALGFAFLSTQVNPTPFLGGTFYPFPIVSQLAFFFDGSGGFAATTTMSAAVTSGTGISIQFLFEDPGAALGVSGSNGLRLVVP